ncbi:helix-turn-helix domain-containing protein [Pseudochelatococcus sp. B33]
MAEPIRRIVCESARLELLPARPYEARYVADADGIGFAFDLQRGMHSFGSDRVGAFCTRPNSAAFVPKGCDVYSRSPTGGEYLVVALNRVPETPLSCSGRFTDVILPPVVAAAHRLRARLLAEAVEPMLVDGEVHELLHRFVLQALPAPVCRDAERWMTSRRLKTITDLVEARLHGPLTVGELARELGLSAGFFTRAFKAATARAPHSYIVDRRIARARRLLSASGRGSAGACGLADVALAAGFSSQAHMTSAFRERLGLSPGRLRQQTARC